MAYNNETPKPVYQAPVFSMGNIIALIVPLVSIAIAWGQMSMRVDSMVKSQTEFVQRMDTDIRSAAQFRAALEQRLRVVEQQNIRNDERFSLILSTMTELKAQVTALTKSSIKRQ